MPRTGPLRALLIGVGTLLALVLALATPAGAATVAPTLTSADAPGFRVSGSGARVARGALSGALPRALRGVPASGTSLRGSGRRTLVSAVFTFSS
ncbi:hypothetical protein VSS74_15055, partial [Conexibacter stalactiti]